MQLCYAGKEDACMLSEILAESWLSAYPGIVPARYLEAISWHADAWEGAFQRLLGGYTIATQVVFLEEKPIGFVSYGNARDEECPQFGEIYSICLLPGHQRQGHGKRMLAAAVEDMRRHRYCDVLLWVFRDNHPARRFYERFGFTRDVEEKTVVMAGEAVVESRYVLHLYREREYPVIGRKECLSV